MKLLSRHTRNTLSGTIAASVLSLALLGQPAQASLPDSVAFTVAMELGDVGKARRWLDEGLAPDFDGDRIGSGLMIGAWEGRIDLMELFLSRGADINHSNAIGEQALQLAAWKGNKAAVQWLLDHGAAVKRADKQWSALHYAAFSGNQELVQLLLDKGADINARAPNESTVLMMAVHEGHQAVVKQLVDAGADTRPVNDRGDSALTWAMRYNRLTIASMVAPPEEFAKAVEAPPESFGPAIASVAAPMEVSEILRQIRIAQAEGRSVDDLRAALFQVAATLQVAAAPPKARRGRAGVDGLVITARRKRPGEERAELLLDGKSQPAMGAATPAAAAAMPSAPNSEVADILYRMRQAQAQGKPVEDLRQALVQAVGRMASAAPVSAPPSGPKAAPALPVARPLPPLPTPVATPPAVRAPVQTAAVAGDSIPDLVRRLRQARADGQPVADLERALVEAAARSRR